MATVPANMSAARPSQRTRFFQTCVGVFQGGGCRAAAFVGAYAEATDRGVHFSELAGTSAGSLVAALVATRLQPAQIEELVLKLEFSQFLAGPEAIKLTGPTRALNFALRYCPQPRVLRVLTHLGMYSSRYVEVWLDAQLKRALPHRGAPASEPVRFHELPIPLHVVATDIDSRGPKVWSRENDHGDSVAKAVRASCSIPFFFQPVGACVDGGILSNLPTFVFAVQQQSNRPLASRILAFALDDEVRASGGGWSARRLFLQLAETIVDGAREIQLQTTANASVVRVQTGEIRATDFDKLNRKEIQGLIDRGRASTAAFFDHELTNVRQSSRRDYVYREEEELTAIVEHLQQPIREILISGDRLDWTYKLFPALLYWRSRGCAIRVLVPSKDADRDRGPHQRGLLRALGAELAETSGSPEVQAILFGDGNPDNGSALVQLTGVDGTVRYSGAVDAAAIAGIRSLILRGFRSAEESLPRPGLEEMLEGDLVRALRGVAQYGRQGVKIGIRPVKLKDVWCLAKRAPEFKLRQVEYLVQLYEAAGIPLFRPAMVRMTDGSTSPVIPPVLEASGEELFAILGASRLAYCRDNNIREVVAVVVEGVDSAQPAHPGVRLDRVEVVARGLGNYERYDNFDPRLFRHIERSVRRTNGLRAQADS